MQLEITIKQAEDQRNLDRQTITDLDSEKKNAEEQRNVQINELKELTFIGSVQNNPGTQTNNNSVNFRSKPSEKNNDPIGTFPIGQGLLFSNWIENDEGRWYRLVGLKEGEEGWVNSKNIDLNGNLPESLKIQPPSKSPDQALSGTIKVDWEFIASLEGKAISKGYVPGKPWLHNTSGVTIASGFDLGTKNEIELKKMGISSGIIEKVKPYFGKQKQIAQDFLDQNLLSLSSEEVSEIDDKNHAYEINQMQKIYDSVSSVPFKDIPSQAQTVIMSLAHQYGLKGLTETSVWPLLTAQKWSEAVTDLKTTFFDYPPRRKAEANFLSQVLPSK